MARERRTKFTHRDVIAVRKILRALPTKTPDAPPAHELLLGELFDDVEKMLAADFRWRQITAVINPHLKEPVTEAQLRATFRRIRAERTQQR